MFIKTRSFLTKVLIVSLVIFSLPQVTNAASLTALSDTMSRLKDSQSADHTIQFTTPTGVASGQTIILTFPTGFDVNAVDGLLDYTDVDVTDDGTDLALLATASGASWGVGVTASAITLTNGNVAVVGGSVVVIQIGANATFGVAGDKQITNQTVAQNNSDPKIVITGSFTDTGSIAVEIVSEDQIPVTATVDPSITFTVANTTLALGALSSSSISTSGYNNITIGTNGSGGYTISVRDNGNLTNPGLYNAPSSKLIASTTQTPLTTNTEGYGGQCNKVGGDGTCGFTGTGENINGFLLTYQTFASHGAKPAGTDTFQIRVKAGINSSTNAGSYTDTLTVVAAANF